jgi:hypothetical protein
MAYVDGFRQVFFSIVVTKDLLRTNAETDFVVDDKVRTALSDLFGFLVDAGLADNAQLLFETCITIRVKLLYPVSANTSGDRTIPQACRSMDLGLLQQWTRKYPRISSLLTTFRKQAISPNCRHPISTQESFDQAVLDNDLFHVVSILNCPENHEDIHGMWDDVLHRAARLGRDKIALAILQDPDLSAHLKRDGFWFLLEYGRISPLSEFVCTYPQIRHALISAVNESNYDRLDDLLRPSVSFSKPLEPLNVAGYLGSRSQIDKSPDSLLGALACYAIHHDDSKLLEWLLEFGLEVYCHFLTAHVHTRSGPCRLPPLLGIAAAHGKTQVVRYLLEREGKDNLSWALSWVTQSQASEESMSIILNAFKSPETNKVARSYSQPLHHAIRHRDYNVIRLLAQSADTNYIVLEDHRISGHDDSFGDSSPLGVAVSIQDIEATTILLEHGGDPNMLAVCWNDPDIAFRNVSLDGALLTRSTSIIAAIDTKNLTMVRLLVQKQSDVHNPPRLGLLADINHSPRLGLLRTPLQRAAEIGCFDIVRYLVEQGAEIDLAPCYGGGTALQLAAMQGHVGIAAFLLERGADPNFPPARGPGRTAFEAAAEWNRIDMMSLLMKWGSRLEMDIENGPDERSNKQPDEPYYRRLCKRYYKGPDGRYYNDTGKQYCTNSDNEVETRQHWPPTSTQYERAMRFAKNSGYMACKRFIEHLYQQCAESTPEGYWDPESFTNAEQDLNWDADFWRQFGLDI